MTLPTCEGQLYSGIQCYPKDIDILDMVQVEGGYVCPVKQQEQVQLIQLARPQPALGYLGPSGRLVSWEGGRRQGSMSEMPDSECGPYTMQVRPETRMRVIQVILLRLGSSPICLSTFLLR